MSVSIAGVLPGSPCAKKRIHPGDTLISVNGNDINDVLDYRFYTTEEKLKIVYRNAQGKDKHFTLHHSDGTDALGLEFETYLMDKHKSCKNHCIFCFIDQLPKGMRESLYFKDDDSRLSFLFGNYITLTNLSEHDVDRIIKMHISPLNASVHTMEPALRVEMMKNPKAGESLALLKRFSDAGIVINAQLVLCPGINDGEHLKISLEKLGELENVRSIAAVPVGLTKYRDGLYPLTGYTKTNAASVIQTVDTFNAQRRRNDRERIAYASDEFYQLAGVPFPDYDDYDDFPQLDNGVGMCVLTEHDFMQALKNTPADNRHYRCSLATGMAAYPLMEKLAKVFCERFPFADITVYGIENSFFGKDVTVAGLITGRDLIHSLMEQKRESKPLFIPSVMLKAADEPIFLDDTGVEDVKTALGCDVTPIPTGGYELFEAFYNVAE